MTMMQARPGHQAAVSNVVIVKLAVTRAFLGIRLVTSRRGALVEEGLDGLRKGYREAWLGVSILIVGSSESVA